MPRKNFRRPKRVYKRKRVPGWGGAIGRVAGVGMRYVSKGGMAYKALRLARKVADAVNIEYKNFDSTATAGAVDNTGGLTTLNGVSNGTSDNNRIGDSFKCQNNVLRFYWARNGQDCIGRLILFWDEQNQASTPADVLQQTTTALSVISPKYYDKRFRSKILYDQIFKINTNSPTPLGDIVTSLNMHTQFEGNTTTINSGALKMLLISNVSGANLPTFSYYNRLTFTDN